MRCQTPLTQRCVVQRGHCLHIRLLLLRELPRRVVHETKPTASIAHYSIFFRSSPIQRTSLCGSSTSSSFSFPDLESILRHVLPRAHLALVVSLTTSGNQALCTIRGHSMPSKMNPTVNQPAHSRTSAEPSSKTAVAQQHDNHVTGSRKEEGRAIAHKDKNAIAIYPAGDSSGATITQVGTGLWSPTCSTAPSAFAALQARDFMSTLRKTEIAKQYSSKTSKSSNT